MPRYLIKATYMEGPHAGKSYLLQKGGMVTDEDSTQWDDTTYKTKGIAQRVCRQLYEDNELSRKIERQDEQIRIKRGQGPKSFYLYESETFEPYPVEDYCAWR